MSLSHLFQAQVLSPCLVSCAILASCLVVVRLNIRRDLPSYPSRKLRLEEPAGSVAAARLVAILASASTLARGDDFTITIPILYLIMRTPSTPAKYSHTELTYLQLYTIRSYQHVMHSLPCSGNTIIHAPQNRPAIPAHLTHNRWGSLIHASKLALLSDSETYGQRDLHQCDLLATPNIPIWGLLGCHAPRFRLWHSSTAWCEYRGKLKHTKTSSQLPSFLAIASMLSSSSNFCVPHSLHTYS
jgi:hypothetical protein